MRPRRRRLARLRRAGRPAPRPRPLLSPEAWAVRKFWAQWPSLVWHARQAAERTRVLEVAFAVIGKKLIDAGVKAIEKTVEELGGK